MKKIFLLVSLLSIYTTLSISGYAMESLVNAYPGDNNTKLIIYSEIDSFQVKETLKTIDLAYEMGDGYYDMIKSATYVVLDQKGEIEGFMETALLSYTEDSEIYLVAAFVDNMGVRLEGIYQLYVFQGCDDDELQNLPVELRP